MPGTENIPKRFLCVEEWISREGEKNQGAKRAREGHWENSRGQPENLREPEDLSSVAG